MLIVNELSPVVQRVVQDAVAANPKSSPYDFVKELSYAVTNPGCVQAIYEEWNCAVVNVGGEGDEDEFDDDDVFDGDGFVNIGEPIAEDIFEEMRVLLMKLKGPFDTI